MTRRAVVGRCEFRLHGLLGSSPRLGNALATARMTKISPFGGCGVAYDPGSISLRETRATRMVEAYNFVP